MKGIRTHQNERLNQLEQLEGSRRKQDRSAGEAMQASRENITEQDKMMNEDGDRDTSL